MNEDFSEFLEEFLNEAEEHLNTINNSLLDIEQEFKNGKDISDEKVNAIFRAVHTIKGLSGMLGFDLIQSVAHAMEDLMGEIREGSRQISENILDILFKCADILSSQIGEVANSGSVETDPSEMVTKLRNILNGNPEKESVNEEITEETAEEPEVNLDFLDFQLGVDNFKPSEIELELLKEAVNKDLNVYMVIKEITADISEDKFNKLPIFNDIEKVGELIFYRPLIHEISKSKRDSLFCYFVFMSEYDIDKIKESFFDEVKILRSSNISKKTTQEDKTMSEEIKSEVFRLEDTGFDESIVAEFFEEVDELIENLDMSLLDLEKNPDDTEILNSIFRVAHTIKGASAMFGFEPIVKLTHSMENLFDNLRKGVMNVDTYIMDTFFEGVDLLKEMLVSLKEDGIIDQNYMPVVLKIREIIESGGSVTESPEANIKEVSPDTTEESSFEIDLDLDNDLKIFLTEEEVEKIKVKAEKGENFFQVNVKYPDDILNTNFKPFEGLFTGLEIAGDIITVFPDISNVPEIDEYQVDKFYFSLKILIASSSSLQDVELLLGGFADMLDIEFLEVSKKEVSEIKEEKKPEPKEDKIEKEESVMKENISSQPAKPKEKPKPAVKKETKTAGKSEGKDTAAQAKKKVGSNTIRVDLERLDKLLNLVGEFVIDRTRFAQISQELREKYPHDPSIIQLNETNQIFGRHMNEIQEVIMSVRMIPIGSTFNKYPRIVRDLARDSGKEINLEISGQETELDKTLVEEIGDPLVHLIRNAVDHGIEPPEEREANGKPRTGTVKLSAHHEGNHIVITIADDGKGIDVEKIRAKGIEKGLIKEDDALTKKEILNLIFEPGFSTAEKVTNISGRGVGMDVVKRNITKLKGIIDIDTEVGKGTTINIKLPLTLAIIQVLMVQVASEIFAIPLPSIIETIRIPQEEIQIIEGYEMITLRDSVLPIARIKEIFKLDEKSAKGSLSYNNELESEDRGKYFVVIVGLAEHRVGLIVDRLITQQEVVIKSLGNLLTNAKGIAGATILGNGKVALILDIGEVIEDSKKISVTDYYNSNMKEE